MYTYDLTCHVLWVNIVLLCIIWNIGVGATATYPIDQDNNPEPERLHSWRDHALNSLHCFIK